MKMFNRQVIKQMLGEVPRAVELYWLVGQHGRPVKGFSFDRLERALPEWGAQVDSLRRQAGAPPGKSILLFATLRYWIQHAALVGMALAGLGNEVTLSYLPYADWRLQPDSFDLHRQNAYTRRVFRGALPWMQAVSFVDEKTSGIRLPDALRQMVEQVSLYDAQYSLQVEDVDIHGAGDPARLYSLRLKRNMEAAQAAFARIRADRPDVVILPNGSILEMGAVYQVARYLGIPAVTYEFGEQRQRIWLAHDGEVMRQETGDLWEVRRDTHLNDRQWDQIRLLFASRQSASLWENFSRLWQGVPTQGGEQARQALGLDGRPVILLTANVIGDSLTLGRQAFSQSMTEWLERTLAHLAARPDVQLVVRIHPGERYTRGPSVAGVVERTLPDLPENIHLVQASDPVNTYDLVELACLGLVYTTTAGLEMAMSGVPVVVAGQTHYRGKGFTYDPDSWESYFDLLEQLIAAPDLFRLTRPQVEQAWNYAYRFFFEYPLPFPWHLRFFWEEFEPWSFTKVLSDEGQAHFGEAFRCLSGERRNWFRARAVEAVSTAEIQPGLPVAGEEEA